MTKITKTNWDAEVDSTVRIGENGESDKTSGVNDRVWRKNLKDSLLHVDDTTVIKEGDARLSDARTPLAHAHPEYLESYTETDPVFVASDAYGITAANITNWNTSFAWGNHALAGYLSEIPDTDGIVEGTANLFMEQAEKTKLAGIEAGATADQTATEIATAYHTVANQFTNTEKAKVAAAVTSTTAGLKIEVVTQATYDGLATKDANTLYHITA